MNNVSLVGRLTHDPEVKENTDGTSRTVINIAISRDYRNSDGIYDADYIRCVLWNGIASATKDYCHKGDVVGVKGRLQSRSYEAEDKTMKHVLEVVVDKVTFISSMPKKAE
ncbi:MAG: single-stranded DNA-binding protein [Bacilli bacterium]|nr:single-stranded DNA-binding protein [Bacilli bacterium]